MSRGPNKGEGGRPRKKAGTNATGKLGYRRVSVGPASKGKQVLEHRAKAGVGKGVGGSAAKGKSATDTTVHHKDHNKGNNSSGNLQPMSRSKNSRIK